MPKRAWQQRHVQQEDGVDEGAESVRKRHGASPQQEAVALAARGAAQQATQVAHMHTDTAQAAVAPEGGQPLAAVQLQAAAAVVRQQWLGSWMRAANTRSCLSMGTFGRSAKEHQGDCVLAAAHPAPVDIFCAA